MKKIFLCLAVCTVALNSCKRDNDDDTAPEVSIETQNDYDNLAAAKYLQEHYLDTKGNIKAFDDDDTSDDNYTKLADFSVTLPSGVIYAIRPAVQPEPGTNIGTNDILRLMANIETYVATKTDDVVSFNSLSTFRNTISTGNVDIDPAYYYVKNSVLKAYNDKNNTTYDHSYYEIEGFREALQYFKAFDIPDESDYNLQGVIIVPSRAAFARDAHYNYTGISFRNRSFIFNFQIYKTSVRQIPAED